MVQSHRHKFFKIYDYFMCQDKSKTSVKDFFYQLLSLNIVLNFEQTLFLDNIHDFKEIHFAPIMSKPVFRHIHHSVKPMKLNDIKKKLFHYKMSQF